VNGVGGALQQLVESEVGRDEMADARNERQPLGAAVRIRGAGERVWHGHNSWNGSMNHECGAGFRQE
jgi:hypothetical protein